MFIGKLQPILVDHQLLQGPSDVDLALEEEDSSIDKAQASGSGGVSCKYSVV